MPELRHNSCLSGFYAAPFVSLTTWSLCTWGLFLSILTQEKEATGMQRICKQSKGEVDAAKGSGRDKYI